MARDVPQPLRQSVYCALCETSMLELLELALVVDNTGRRGLLAFAVQILLNVLHSEDSLLQRLLLRRADQGASFVHQIVFVVTNVHVFILFT